MKQRKIGISLAVVAAIAAPFALGTYKANPTSEKFVPLKARVAEIKAVLAETNNCQTHLDRVWQIIDEIRKREPVNELIAITDHLRAKEPGADYAECNRYLKVWNAGGAIYQDFSLSKYLALNVLAAAAGFAAIFGLSYLLPALSRRYWRWLNT